MAVQVKAKEAGMNSEFKRGDQMQKRVDSALKAKSESMRARASQQSAPARMQ